MIFVFCIGVISGFILTWLFIYHRVCMCGFYESEYDKYYEKWFNLHKRACEAWHISKDCYENDNMSDLANKVALKNIFFMLDAYYGDDE